MNQKTCPNCGALMPEDSKFCTECGSPFPVEKKEEKQAPRPAVQDNPPAETKPSSPELPDELFTEEPVRPVQAQPPRTEAQAAAQAAAPAAAAVGYAAQAAPANPAPAAPASAYGTARPAANASPSYSPAPQQTPAAAAYPVGAYPAANAANAMNARPASITAEDLRGTPLEPIHAWGWVGIFLLLGIPVVNLVLLIVWAVGGCRKDAKKSFARGVWLCVLIAIVILVILGIVFVTVGRPFVNEILNQFGYELV